MKEGGGWKSWRKRWFVLKDGCLYYSKKKGSKTLGIVRLENASHIKPSTARPSKKNVFEVPTPDRIYYMSAPTPQEKENWITVCRAAKKALNDKLNPPETSGTAGGGSSGSGGSGSTERVGVEDFDLMKVIGKGSFGKVLLVRKRDTGKVYAMKVLDKATILEKGELAHTRAEKSILQKLDCPFLVKLHFTFQTSDKLYFIMTFVNGGELFYHLQQERKFDADRVRFYCAEIVMGLAYLHEKGILYRDLKPENVLLTGDGHICMTDFGISKEGLQSSDARATTFCGTPEYLAPEVLEGVAYGKAVDWWSFGTLMYEMLTGLPPFYSQDVQVMYQKIMTAKLVVPDSISADAASLLRGLLERDPEQRLSDPAAIKAHAYFKDIDWDALNRKEVTPPFLPKVTSPEDVRNIDPTFTGEDVKLESDAAEISSAAQSNFSGFTWKDESVMGS